MIQLTQQGIILAKARTPLLMDGITGMVAVGDSITFGTAASPSSNSFVNKIGTRFSLSVDNRAVSGRGSWQSIKSVNQTPYTRSVTLLSAMFGFNDWRRGGTNAKTFKKVQAGYRYMMAKFITQTAIASGSSSVTRTGTFASFAAGVTIGFANPNGTLPGNFNSYSTTAGATWEYTFTGAGIGFIFGALDGVTYTGWGVANVYIDNVLVGTFDSIGWYDAISDGSYDNGRGPVPYIITGLTKASHTIKVESQTTANIVLDYFFELIDPAIAGNLILWKTPKMDATGYATSPANATDAIFDAADAMIVSEAQPYIELGYKIRVADTNAYYNVSTGLDTDHIHPNNTGHDQIYNAGLSVLV